MSEHSQVCACLAFVAIRLDTFVRVCFRVVYSTLVCKFAYFSANCVFCCATVRYVFERMN